MYKLFFTLLTVSFSTQILHSAQVLTRSRPHTPEFQEYIDKKLRKAAGRNDNDYIEILIERDNAQINSQSWKTGRTALHKAIIDDCEAAVDILLKYGADPEIEDYQCKTATVLASELGHERIATKLRAASQPCDTWSWSEYLLSCFCFSNCFAQKNEEL